MAKKPTPAKAKPKPTPEETVPTVGGVVDANGNTIRHESHGTQPE